MSKRNWDDLKPRVLSAIVMAIVGAAAVWAGGYWFIALIAISSGLMMWELTRMIAPPQTSEAVQMGVITTISVVLSAFLPGFYIVLILLAPVLVGGGLIKGKRSLFVPYALMILLAGYGFIYLRQDLGLIWMLWLLLVVIASDIGGYLAGRMLGGPKFWPA
ncbi:phosphatidate cytidylyltransferase, partial [Profundibacter sp.]